MAYLAYELYRASSDSSGLLINGHFTINDKIIREFTDRWSFITVLREPVSRWISHYFFNLTKDNELFPVDQSIEAFIDSSEGQDFGNLYVRHLTMGSRETDQTARIELAKDVLSQFAVVGIMEDIPQFLHGLKSQLGISLQVEHLNANPTSSTVINEAITPDRMEQIKVLCQPDLQIYAHALELIQSQ